MKRIFIIIILALSFFIVRVDAASKEDIISYANSQSVCGDSGIFNSYKSQFTRMIKQKEISQDNLNKIYSHLTSAVNILKSKNACKLSDLNKLSDSEKKSVYNHLMTGANIITSSPNIDLDKPNSEEKSSSNDSSSSTNITIDTKTNTMDIYEDGVLVDKLPLGASKMTYTGNNPIILYFILTSLIIFILSLFLYLMIFKKHTKKIRIIKNIFISLMICSLSLGLIVYAFKDDFDSLTGIIKLMSFTKNNNSYDASISNDKTIIKAPSYGYNYAKLYINNLNIENNIYYGDDQSILSLGVGHTTYSDMPGEGGTIIYSAHNRKDFLYNLKDINKNDKIVIETSYAKLTYNVIDIKVLKETQTDKLTNIDSKETLILYTCYPFDSSVYSTDRYVVFSTLESKEWK